MVRIVPPGPRGQFLLGSIKELQQEPLAFLTALGRTYGEMSSFVVAGKRFYFVNHPDLIRQLLADPNFVRTELSDRFLRVLLGQGLFTQEGVVHRQQRGLMQPAFHRRRIDAYADLVVSLTERTLSTWQEGQVRDTTQDMMKLTFEIASELLFGAKTDGVVDEVRWAFKTASKHLDAVYPVYVLMPKWFPLFEWGDYGRATRILRDVTRRIVHERRQHLEDRGDLLSMLLLAQDQDGGRMTEEQVMGQVLTLLVAGHETTANLLSWALYLLAQHSRVRKKLHAELDPPAQVHSAMAQLENLRYTNLVIKEALRLYPPAWYAERTPTRDTLLGGYQIPAGATVVYATYVTHRDPAFFERPDEFIPERFEGADEKKLAYFPFGAGRHLCIGNKLAEIEACLILAKIARRFELELDAGAQVTPIPQITLGIEGLKMRLAARGPSDEAELNDQCRNSPPP